METISTIINKDIDQVQNITPLKKLENDYNKIRKQLIEIKNDPITPKHHRLYKKLVDLYYRIDVILKG